MNFFVFLNSMIVFNERKRCNLKYVNEVFLFPFFFNFNFNSFEFDIFHKASSIKPKFDQRASS